MNGTTTYGTFPYVLFTNVPTVPAYPDIVIVFVNVELAMGVPSLQIIRGGVLLQRHSTFFTKLVVRWVIPSATKASAGCIFVIHIF